MKNGTEFLLRRRGHGKHQRISTEATEMDVYSRRENDPG